ncbi:MAG: efflux RND transporter periplasmic adaptor subunit [Negativicutes bacterium]|nr:efflux RND transporter periplasmic adaptor subunit [Negativicutes bacterium]
MLTLKPKKLKPKKILIPVAVVVILAAAFLIYRKLHHPPAPPPQPMVVGMMKVASGNDVSAYSYAGSIVPRNSSNLGFQVGGIISSRKVNLGDVVRAGQVLYTLDPQDYNLKLTGANAQVAAAQSALELASVNHRRAAALLEQGAISQLQYDEQYNNYQKARDNLTVAVSNRDEASRQVGYTLLTAPADGIITQIIADVGDVVNASQNVVGFAFMSDWEAQINVSELDRTKIKPGDRVDVSFWALNDFQEHVPGHIREIAGAADPNTRTFLVKVALDKLPRTVELGMTCRVNINPASTGQIYIPLSALVTNHTDQPYVWVVENGLARQRQVTTGQYGASDNIAILSGLNVGETIVTSGVIALNDGEKVAPYDGENRRLGW